MSGYYEGGGYVRRDLRLAIQGPRGGWCCIYCERSVIHDNIGLTLDHLYGKKGDPGHNDPKNLVPCCWDCNNARGRKAVHVWLDILARSDGPEGFGVNIGEVLRRMHLQTSMPITAKMRDQGKELLKNPPAFLTRMWENNKARFKDRSLGIPLDEGWRPDSMAPEPLSLIHI